MYMSWEIGMPGWNVHRRVIPIQCMNCTLWSLSPYSSRKRNPRCNLRCLSQSPAMRSNAGMAIQIEGRRFALSRKSPPSVSPLVGRYGCIKSTLSFNWYPFVKGTLSWGIGTLVLGHPVLRDWYRVLRAPWLERLVPLCYGHHVLREWYSVLRSSCLERLVPCVKGTLSWEIGTLC
jgi:hypothetical protein